MSRLKEKLAAKIPGLREEIQNLLKEYGEKVVSEVSLQQMFGGMRGVKSMICDTSLVDPYRGLLIRGRPILDLVDCEPEEIFHLLLLDELPDAEDLKELKSIINSHGPLPDAIWNAQKAMAPDTHPMARFSAGILMLERESKFRRSYDEGMKKSDYWEAVLDDSLHLLSMLPELAAGIYRLHTGKGDPIPPDSKLSWSQNYAYMLGLDNPNGEFADLMRLYLVLHSDHEGGNVSAFTTHVVGSALSDPYYSVSAGMNGLAGPLHGLANQECLHFVFSIREKYNGVPTDDQLKEYCWETLNSGKVIPGYGHAVLRETDPRFIALHNFGLKHCQNSDVFRIVDRLYNLVPDILLKQGKAKNPYPNVDAGSGSLLFHYGLKEYDYYTVLFGVSRAMGMLSQLVLNRALGSPIFRPKSISTEWIKSTLGAE